MKGFTLAGIPVGFLLTVAIAALPHFSSSPSHPPHQLKARGGGMIIPRIPERPSGVGPNSFHGIQFQYFDDLGFVSGSPGVEAAPVFLYARTGPTVDPCYPESAVLIGSNPPEPNPGTDTDRGTLAYNPGADCTNPGAYHGQMTIGDPFPVHVSAAWCGDVWKINYDVYYVHDGNMLAGHKHDWEGVTIVFAKDPAANGDDWWYRAGAQYNHHSDHDWYKYSDLETVDVDVPGTSDVANMEIGKNLKHPKVYVGLYSHSAYAHGNNGHPTNSQGSNEEYRSDDWWRLPRKEDLHSWKEIDAAWDYGGATSDPVTNHNDMCYKEAWKIGELSPP